MDRRESGKTPRQLVPVVLTGAMGKYGGELWDAAERDGRIKPGRGPNFTKRVLPDLAPLLRKDALDQGIPRSAVDRSDRPTRGVLIPPEEGGPFPERLGPCGWSSEDPGEFQWDIVTRGRAHWLLARDAVAIGWLAAAMHGLPHWADSEPVVFFSTHTRRSARSRFGAKFRTPPADLVTVRPDPLFPELRSVDAATAAVQCLSSVMRGKKTWWIPSVPGMGDREVRAVQLIDAFYQCTHVTARQILVAARGTVSRRVVKRVLALCDQGAQSPMETVLRLLVRDTLADVAGDHVWSSQVTVVLGTWYRKRTTPDLACVELKVALYYDGRHHDEDDQNDTDFRLFQQLKDLGWEVVRVNRDLLSDLEELMKQVDAAIARAVAAAEALAAPPS